ncbi:unnamed protein product [Amoebophrya sp. A120]|nr:unnamed protein product [Amoebophrya sp. A120]|eukprot:GSA120T00018530001.1
MSEPLASVESPLLLDWFPKGTTQLDIAGLGKDGEKFSTSATTSAALKVRLHRIATFCGMILGFPIYWILASISLTVYCLFFSTYWTTKLGMIFYIAFIYFDGPQRIQGTGYDQRLTNFVTLANKRFAIWKICMAYYPMRIYKTSEEVEDAEKHPRLMFVTHPHGVFGIATQGNLGTFGSGVDRLFPKRPDLPERMRLMALETLLYLPFVREYFLLGGIYSPSRASFRRIFARGEFPVLNLGGAAESLVYQENNELKVILKNRKGFVKVALENGASLVPCIAFEENQAFHVFRPNPNSFVGKMQKTMQKTFKFGLPLFYGNLLPFHPRRHPQPLYIGAPLAPEAPIESPTQAQIDEKHTQYVRALQKLFDEYKAHAGHPDWVLKITDDQGRE